MSLPSYKRDAVGQVESRMNTYGSDQPSPFRQNQLVSGDRRASSPLQRYPIQNKTLYDKYPRACKAAVVVTFLALYTG